MITALLLPFLSVCLTILVGSVSLPFAKWLVLSWVRLYTSFVPNGLAERRMGEILSDIHEQINACSNQGYRPAEIAPKLIYRWIAGFTTDILWCTPYAKMTLSNRVLKLSQSIWALRKSKGAIPAIVVLGLLNYAYFNSSGGRTYYMWLLNNAMAIAMIILMSQLHRLWVRRVLFFFIGTSGVGSVGYLAWLIGPTKLIQLIEQPDFRGLMLGMMAICLILLTADKPTRNRLFKGRWAYAILCWIVITVASLFASWSVAGNSIAVLSAWAAPFELAAAMFAFVGIVTMIGIGIWYSTLKAGSFGLEVLANSLHSGKE